MAWRYYASLGRDDLEEIFCYVHDYDSRHVEISK